MEQRRKQMAGINPESGKDIMRARESADLKESAISWFENTGVGSASERIAEVGEEGGMNRLIEFYDQFEENFKILERSSGVSPKLMTELRALNQELLKAKAS